MSVKPRPRTKSTTLVGLEPVIRDLTAEELHPRAGKAGMEPDDHRWCVFGTEKTQCILLVGSKALGL